MSSEYYVKTEGLSVGYDGTPVVADIEITLKKGEIMTVIGPNGSGKTTFLKSLIRRLEPVAGIVMLEKLPIEQISLKELAKKMAVVLTDRLQTELMTVADVVGTGRYPYTGRFGILNEADRKIVSEAMELVQISGLQDKEFDKLSDGQRQKVMLARALAQQPDIIVLDEPTSYLDIKNKLEFLSILKKLSEDKGLTVIMSMHEVELATRISDKLACFRNGKLDRIGKPDEIFKDDYMIELFDIRLEEVNNSFREMLSFYS